jgi:hypothetical protein
MREEVLVEKFEKLSTEIAEIKSIQKNTYTEVMLLRGWKDDACTDKSPCQTHTDLKNHLEGHKENKSDFKWSAAFAISAVATIIVTLIIKFIEKLWR